MMRKNTIQMRVVQKKRIFSLSRTISRKKCTFKRVDNGGKALRFRKDISNLYKQELFWEGLHLRLHIGCNTGGENASKDDGIMTAIASLPIDSCWVDVHSLKWRGFRKRNLHFRASHNFPQMGRWRRRYVLFSKTWVARFLHVKVIQHLLISTFLTL